MNNERIKIKKGETLFSEGDAPGCAYLIESGVIEVRSVRDNEIIVLGTLYERALLGEMSVIDTAPRSATAVALEDCSLLMIGKDKIVERIVKSDPLVHSLLLSSLRRYRSGIARLKGEEHSIEFTDTNNFERLTIDKIKLEAQLMTALKDRTLDVSYQPILDISNNTIAGYEALVRWHHPEKGYIAPNEFIALAEETSLIIQVGEYIIDEVITAIRTFILSGVESRPFITINVSAKQLAHPGLIESVLDRVEDAGIPNDSLQLEITEGLLLVEEEIKHVIKLCHDQGILVTLDAFGTGFSNLNIIHNLNFDTIKIHKSFTREMVNNKRSLAIVKSIIHLANELNATSIVEGIENEDLLDLSRTLQCKYAQGYHIGKPEPLEKIIDNLEQ